MVREPLWLGTTNWSYNDLLSVLNVFIIPAFPFAGIAGFGLVIVAFPGLIAQWIANRRLK